MSWLRSRSRSITPRQILCAGFVAFMMYAFPGFVGWDSQASLLQTRAGHYTDAHPPVIAALWRIAELFVAGPLGMLLVQALTLLAGVYLVLVRMLAPRAAALAAVAVFAFPPICGVTALIDKDALMAGFVVLGIGLVLHDRRGWAIAALVAGTAMRWNSLAATFTPVVLLLVLRDAAGWKRYALAIVTWVGITAGAFALNTALTDDRAYAWYGTHAYQDIFGTLHHVAMDDAELARTLEGVPMLVRDHLRDRIDRDYNAADYRQLQKDFYTRIVAVPQDDGERDAVVRTWRAVVLGHPRAYLTYRWDNFRELVRIDKVDAFSQVYVWFHVIADDDSALLLDHDADASRVQAHLRGWAIWISNGWLYYPFIYLAIALLLVPFTLRDRLAFALLSSGLAYQAAWFFLAPTTDFRYSQWMIVTTALAGIAVVAKRLARPAT